MSHDGETLSCCLAGAEPLTRQPLKENTRADVCVVGAGIAGLTTAYLLAKEGRSVVVLDQVDIAGGQTGRTTAHLTYVMDDAWRHIYEPTRRNIRSAPEFMRENLNVVRQYADWLQASEVHSEGEIAPGEGAVIRHGMKLVATYRDREGTLHQFSAACTHLGCMIHWNKAEHTWDCPCHGLRYDCFGNVIDGPAIAKLRPYRRDAEAVAVPKSNGHEEGTKTQLSNPRHRS